MSGGGGCPPNLGDGTLRLSNWNSLGLNPSFSAESLCDLSCSLTSPSLFSNM